MSTYSSQEEKVILKNDDKIISIDLLNNVNLKVLIIDNLSNLEKIEICINEGLYVSIYNCENLIDIKNNVRYLEDDKTGSQFYLGENLKSLKYIDLAYYKIVKIADKIFDKLESLHLMFIQKLICDFNNFPKLDNLSLKYVNTLNLIVNSELIYFLAISYCSFENIDIIGKDNIERVMFNNNEYKSLKTEHPIKVTDITLNNDDKVVSYIPISDEIDRSIIFYFSVDNIYDSEYKFFIKKNKSKVKIHNSQNGMRLRLKDIKFTSN